MVVSANTSPLTQAEKDSISLAMHSAMHHMVRGEGTRELWEIITGSLNLAIIMDEQVYQKSHYEALDAAMQAHCNCGNRYKGGNNFGYTGKELQAVNDAIVIHEAQLDQLTFKELQNALNETTNRLRNRRHKYSVFQKQERIQAHAK